MAASSTRRSFLVRCLGLVSGSVAALHRGIASAALKLADSRSSTKVADFSFLHFSDTHIDPRLVGQPYSEDGRSVKTLAWFAARSHELVQQQPYEISADLPAFAIHTGDVMEYGPVGFAWQDFEKAISNLGCDLWLVPGNHDNTWGEINHLMRHKYGSDSYSFDHGGCHFVCINSSGFLDALPCLDRRTLDWVKADLEQVDHDKPIFLALHHPLSGDAGYASEFDKLRLSELLAGRKIVLIMDGHWHTVHHQMWQGIDRVNGGATFGTHTGYNTVTMSDGVVRVVFEYEKTGPDGSKLVPLLEKRLDSLTPLPHNELDLQSPIEVGGMLTVKARSSIKSRGRAWIDGDKSKATKFSRTGIILETELATEHLCPGWHYVTARVRAASGPAIRGAKSFQLLPAASADYQVVETRVAAGVKARPLIVNDRVYLGTTAGEVLGMSRSLDRVWSYATESQIVHSLSTNKDFLLAGDVDGTVHCLRATDGKLLWRVQLNAPIYSAATIADDVAYVADGAGNFHAIQCFDGALIWSRKITDYSFEAQPLLHGNHLVAGAWDGFIYAIGCDSGRILWKSWCPKGHLDSKSRYYGSADVSPIVCQQSLVVCDRGWVLGKYSLSGEFEKVLLSDVTAIGGSSDEKAIYAKMLDDRLLKLDATGRVLWEVASVTGRAPTPPVEFGSCVAVLSDTGILIIYDAKTGAKRLEYSVSPRLFCLAGLGSDGEKILVTADMDGLVTSIVVDFA